MGKRKKVSLNMTVVDIAVLMSEGNPGALRVIGEILESDPQGPFILLDLDDMNIRGSQVWVGYKDYCGQNINKFKDAAKARDPKMVAVINHEMLMDPTWKEIAVVNRASF